MINSGLTCQHINIIRTKVPKAGVSCIPNKCFYSSNTDTLLYFDPPPSHLRTPLLSIDFSHFVFYCPLFLLFFPRLVVYLPHYSRPSAASAILCLSDFHPNTEINFCDKPDVDEARQDCHVCFETLLAHQTLLDTHTRTDSNRRWQTTKGREPKTELSTTSNLTACPGRQGISFFNGWMGG